MIVPAMFAVSLLAPPDHWFGSDKVKHFLVAAFTESVSYSLLQLAGVKHEPALGVSLAVTAAVSVGKEVHDRRTTGLFSVRDLVWDAAGAAAATVLIDRSMRRVPAGDARGGRTTLLARMAERGSGIPVLSGAAPEPIFRRERPPALPVRRDGRAACDPVP